MRSAGQQDDRGNLLGSGLGFLRKFRHLIHQAQHSLGIIQELLGGESPRLFTEENGTFKNLIIESRGDNSLGLIWSEWLMILVDTRASVIPALHWYLLAFFKGGHLVLELSGIGG